MRRNPEPTELSATLVLVLDEDQERSYSLQLSEARDRPVRLHLAEAHVLLALKAQAEHLGRRKVWGDPYSLATFYKLVFDRSITRARLEADLDDLVRSLRRNGFDPTRLVARNRKTGQPRLARTLHVQPEEAS